MDAFEIYRQWFQHHYGREFICTREQWNAWCAKRTYDAQLLADQEEIDRERKEGWTY